MLYADVGFQNYISRVIDSVMGAITAQNATVVAFRLNFEKKSKHEIKLVQLESAERKKCHCPSSR